jgi:hypothetical protein
MRNKIYILITLTGLFFSCRKDVKVKLPEYKERLVVEANIETGKSAVVLLSWSVPFFGDFDYSTPEKAFVKGAFVTVTDGTVTDTISELDPTTGYIYLGTPKLVGQVGKTYTLRIVYNAVEYSVSSTILPPVALDSLYFKWEEDSLGFIWQHLNEPAGFGNHYRWAAKRLNPKYQDNFFASPLFSVFDDKFVDGKPFDFSYDRGPQPDKIQEWRDDPNRAFFRVGDTVAVKFSQIGQAEYDFFYTYYENKTSNSNPFSAPTNIKSMFGLRQDVFGAFVAYSTTFDTLAIKKKP